ncbi:MAG: nucleotidyltransferase domain-containing protein, partial [Mycobacterium sp.]
MVRFHPRRATRGGWDRTFSFGGGNNIKDDGGEAVSSEAIDDRWDAWSPAEVAYRLSAISAPWCVVAGWALDLFVGEVTRAHDDIEIAVPAAGFDEIAAALPGYEWDVVGDGRIWQYPGQFEKHFQTWLREPATGTYRLDVFREPHIDERWVCRRDPAITLTYDELILRTGDSIPYVLPEVALLFKAKHRRAKDEADFQRVLPELGA